MKNGVFFLLFTLGLYLIPFTALAQEKELDIDVEKSAALFLEEYSDNFQESFFEALKQKGIENHDKAINLFLECKRLDADNIVVDHELAKAYLADKQYVLAQEYGFSAVNSEPENPWYLTTLVEILQRQGSSIDIISGDIPFENSKLKENLALIYYKNEDYERSLVLLKNIKKSSFSIDLASKINDSIEKRNKNTKKTKFSISNNSASNPLESYKMQIDGFIRAESYMMLQQYAEEALETYPSQPYFYYAQGYALTKNGKHQAAVETLEAALDYLVDDISLTNKIYTTLVDAYNGLNNSVKANMYLRKIKPGF